MTTTQSTPPVTEYIKREGWDSTATKYNDAAGRTSAKGAALLIDLVSSLEPSLSHPNAYVFELGAGTGSLTHLLSSRYPSLPILATDISPLMLKQLTHNIPPSSQSNISTKIADMNDPLASLGEDGEGKFSHVFCTMALHLLEDPGKEKTLSKWSRLLRPSGVLAVAIWDFENGEGAGPLKIWAEAATAVDPTYIPPEYPDPSSERWTSTKKVERGMKEAGYKGVKAETYQIGFNVGTEAFMEFFWDSGNPMTVHRRATWTDQSRLGEVRREMERIVNEKYEEGWKIPMSAGLIVGRRLVDEEDVVREDVVKEDVVKEDVVKGDVVKGDFVKKDAVEEGFAGEDIMKRQIEKKGKKWLPFGCWCM
ncbi:S-adenosyl-L-methionine-dependent methyltransferase [Tricladium varicosporioides]|nr:S-adenosyl-L-methionine-dependent methyltransferase [Hymenoscyphus varicosporioides]